MISRERAVSTFCIGIHITPFGKKHFKHMKDYKDTVMEMDTGVVLFNHCMY